MTRKQRKRSLRMLTYAILAGLNPARLYGVGR